MNKYFISLIAILFIMCGFNSSIFAEENQIDYSSLYNQAIQEGVLDRNTVSLEQWTQQNKEEFYPVYVEGIQAKVFDQPLTYAEWLKLNNYGQAPKTNSDTLEDVTLQYATWKGVSIKAGDIFITNAAMSKGILGHAAIANGDNYILDMPGYGEGNRQSRATDWLNEYSQNGRWIKVYRVKDQTLARQVASYADRNFYSSTGSATRNIKLDYNLSPHLYSKNPTYCSKLVFQAYYYGSGSKPVMKSPSGYVLPYGLVDTFNDSYKPSLVKQFNG